MVMIWERKKGWKHGTILPDLNKWNLTVLFDSSFPAPSESFLSRIVVCQDRVKNEKFSPFPLCRIVALLILHAKIRWLQRCITSLWMNERSKCSAMLFVKMNENHTNCSVLLALPNWNHKHPVCEMDRLKICTRMSSMKQAGWWLGGGGGG